LYRISAKTRTFRRHAPPCAGAALALAVGTMMHVLRPVPLALALAFVHLVPAAPMARPADDAADRRARAGRPAPHDRRIRTTDRRVRALIDEAALVSPALRALVDRLERSDVVVYVQCDGGPPPPIAGRLSFVAAAGGLRYVMVRVKRLDSRVQQIALLAHELQHAVEIADTPAIVDAASLAREYARFGLTRISATGGLAFDTNAAVEMGKRVLAELRATAGD
jgi:hypothetical protein